VAESRHVLARAVEVSARGLTFAYGPRAEPILDGLDLDLPAGSHLAVVGASGIGKSTLAALICGQLVPTGGTVRLNGTDPAGLDPADRARLRVYIPQEAHVFSATLRDNLRYLNAAASDVALDRAVEAVGMSQLRDRLGGYDGVVQPAVLSAGERQLIALTRAWLSPASLAVLDEATCHLDPAAEARAEQAFAARPGTVIVIAHRITSARRAETVLVLDGVHTRAGSHHQLLNASPMYRDLVGHWDDGSPEPLPVQRPQRPVGAPRPLAAAAFRL
jgi:ATP-binding cassette subfamily C protein